MYKKEREAYVAELGKTEGRYREMFEAWGREDKTVAVLGHSKWVEKAGSDIGRIGRLGKTLFTRRWQSRNDWPSVIDPVGTMLRPLEDAWSMVNGLRTKAYKS